MTTTASGNTDSRDEAPVKAVWTRPTFEFADIDARTQAGGIITADLDANLPS